MRFSVEKAIKAIAKRPLYPPGVQSAVDYADAVIAGTVDAGRLVHLACERFSRDRADHTWEFRADLAERAMDFAGQMPNIKGKEAGYPLRLMPWQRLVFANLFGFVEPGTSTRRFRQGVVFVPRGIADDKQARECVRTIAGWQKLRRAPKVARERQPSVRSSAHVTG
jgi:hypothetical protein